METKELIGLAIAFISVTGGLGIGAVAVYVSVNKEKEERLARINAQHKERLALIEKGLDPTVLDKKPNNDSSTNALIWGLLLGGVGFGAFCGDIIAEANHWSQTFLVNAFALLFGGVGLIVFYILSRTIAKKKIE